MPGLGLECDEQDEQAISLLRELFGVATLGVRYRITASAQGGVVRAEVTAPLRVLGSLDEPGDGGIDFLIEKLAVKDAADKLRLHEAYERARLTDYQTREAIA